jgi:thiosulfate dehydrogenase [quinone] large subunit
MSTEAEIETDSPTGCSTGCPDKSRGLTYGALLLRLWLAVRAIQTGIEKFAGTTTSDQPVPIDGVPNSYGLSAATSTKEYALSHYHGVPDALFTKFAAEPLMRLPGPLETLFKEWYKWCGGKFDGVKLSLAGTDPAATEAWDKFLKEPFMLNMYNLVLGPALLVLGVTILLGIANRVSLFLLGVLYISLTWGLILIKSDDGISWLGVHMILIVMALALAEHNRFVIFKKW